MFYVVMVHPGSRARNPRNHLPNSALGGVNMSRNLRTFGVMGLGAVLASFLLASLLFIPGSSQSRAQAQSTSVSLGENTEYISPEL